MGKITLTREQVTVIQAIADALAPVHAPALVQEAVEQDAVRRIPINLKEMMNKT